jgi:hypothetical protein
MFRSTSLVTALSGTNVVPTQDEPSVANDGRVALYTGNQYAAVSQDGGTSFSYIDPFHAFPADYGVFCCDQVVRYEPTRNLFFWVLQYGDGSAPNVERLAVAHGSDGLIASAWTYYDITPALLGFPGYFLDYPQVAFSSNDLYMTSNVFQTSAPAAVASTLTRIALDALASGGRVPADSGYVTPAITLTPASGSSGTMFLVGNKGATATVYAWPESGGIASITSAPVAHAQPPAGVGTCPGPDGLDWCGHDDGRVKTAWVSNGVLGFLFDEPQGTSPAGTFAYPYVQGARVSTSTFALIDQPYFYSSNYAYAYPSVAVNGAGNLGLTIAYGGGALFPSVAVGIEDDVSGGAFQLLAAAVGTSGPPIDWWGDFLSIQPDSGRGNTWVATGFTIQWSGTARFVEPRFFWFGRQRDNPLPAVSYVAYFALYDNASPGVQGDNIHVVNPTDAAVSGSVSVAGQSLPFGVTPGGEQYLRFAPGTIGGPVVVSSSGRVIASQRVQYNQSFNEVPAQPASAAETRLSFPWFDRISSPGFRSDNIHVINPGGAAASVTVHIPGCSDQGHDLAAAAAIYFTCANGYGGPVTVTASSPVLASQRVIYYDTFNEVVAQPQAVASKRLVFTWFDRISSPGFQGDNVHVVNPGPATANVTISIPGQPGCAGSAAIPSAGEVYFTCPSGFGGPVVVNSDTPVLGSQRVQYYGSFNEVAAMRPTAANEATFMPWFDRISSPGFQGDNVHVVNPQTATTTVAVLIPGCGTQVANVPGNYGELYFTCPSGFGGPVKIVSALPILASQRVQYFSSFNEAAGNS